LERPKGRSKHQIKNKVLLFLQMQHAVLDLLRAALIPELGADITAGAAGNVQLVLVAVAALGALPHQLAVVLTILISPS